MSKLFLITFSFILCYYSVHSFTNDLDFINNSNEFSLKLLNILPQNENHFYSPLSLTYSLYALLNGAGGQTETDLRNVLSITSNDSLQSINRDIKTILKLIRDKNLNEVVVRFANRILFSNAFNLTEDFQNSIQDEFNSSVVSVDFLRNATDLTTGINDWIKEQTNDKIPKLFDNLDQDTVMVLANALYFKAPWSQPFEVYSTSNQTFYGQTKETTVPMMRTSKNFRYSQIRKLNTTLLELPFSGRSNLSMIVLLPNERNGLTHLKEGLDSKTLNSSLNELFNSWKTQVILHLPKFNLETDYDLKNPLSALGLSKLFTDNANLSRITGQNNIKVSQAVHKAVLKVEESGIEAAAAVGITAVAQSGSSRITEVTVDRPFLFLIQDTQSGLVLFMGQVCDIPSQK